MGAFFLCFVDCGERKQCLFLCQYNIYYILLIFGGGKHYILCMKHTVAISSDHGGYALKEEVKSRFANVDWVDLGCDSLDSVDYPDFGKKLADAVSSGEVKTGILICGTGIGISIEANRNPAVRCGLCTDTTMARLTRQHNDANVLALGARITGGEAAMDIVDVFLNTEFEGGRHQTRIDKLS